MTIIPVEDAIDNFIVDDDNDNANANDTANANDGYQS